MASLLSELCRRLENVGMAITSIDGYDEPDYDWGVTVDANTWTLEMGKMVQHLDGFEFVGQAEVSDMPGDGMDDEEVIAYELYYKEVEREPT
jgi:hypothetical protein